MSKIPLPERGQPMDVTYIYQIANAVNDLASQISPSTYKYVTVDTVNAGKQSVKASEARVIGGYVNIYSDTTVNSGNEKSFSYDFPADFKYAPICTATPINIGGTPAGGNVSVVLKTVNTSRVEGVVRFNTSGNLTVGVNLIVIGIPN